MPREKKEHRVSVYNMPHWVLISSFEDYSQKLSKVTGVEVQSWEKKRKDAEVDFRDVAWERLFHHIFL